MGSWGWYETFAYDDQTEIPTFYVTRDDAFGFITRFTPDQNGMACYNSPNDDDRWCTLNHGRNDYLLLSGGPNGWTSGTFSWTLNRRAAERNANDYYWYNEGLAIVDRVMYFTSKTERRLYILDLQRGTYTSQSTQAGPQRDGSLEDQPDQIAHLYRGSEDIVYFCEGTSKLESTVLDCGMRGLSLTYPPLLPSYYRWRGRCGNPWPRRNRAILSSPYYKFIHNRLRRHNWTCVFTRSDAHVRCCSTNGCCL